PQEGHVAAWNVLCFGIRKQHVHRVTRGVCHACSDGSVVRWRDVGPPGSDIVTIPKRLSQVSEPVRIRICVVVDVGDNLTVRRLPSDISGMAQAMVRRADEPEVILGYNRRRIIRRPIVDDNHLEVRVAELRDTLQTFADGSAAVVAADYYRNPGPIQIRREGCFGKGPLAGRQSRLGGPISTREPEFPIVYFCTCPVPFVSPRKDEGAGTS